jgi:hypothetical protein
MIGSRHDAPRDRYAVARDAAASPTTLLARAKAVIFKSRCGVERVFPAVSGSKRERSDGVSATDLINID